MSGYWYLETNVQLSNEKPNLWARIENVKMGLRCGQAPGTQVKASTSVAGGRGWGARDSSPALAAKPQAGSPALRSPGAPQPGLMWGNFACL